MELTFEERYKGHPINTNKEKGLGCDREILDTYKNSIDNMIENHSQVMQTRFDLRYPSDGSVAPDPKHIHRFNYNFKRRLNRQKNKGHHFVDARLLGVREKNESGNSEHPHFHYIALTNANATLKWHPIVNMANEVWKRVLNTEAEGLIDYCNKGRDGTTHPNGIRIRKCDPDFQEKYNDCFYQASYLAKQRGKENPPKGKWRVNHSRIPK